MAKQLHYLSIISDERAEGSAHGSDVDDTLPLSERVPELPQIKPMSSDVLAGETGVMPAIFISAEGSGEDESQDASRTTAEISPAPAPVAQLSGERRTTPLVLIVEDTIELAEVIQATLERLNMVAVVEGHGDSALRRYEQLRPDVVLLDIALPDTSGWRILETIKEMQNVTTTLPIIIVITAYGDAANRLVGKLQNVHNYLVKPFTADEVAAVVTDALNSKVG
jgi:CheY-like chemotaxis protein